MQLTWVSDDGEVIRLQCDGEITLTDFRTVQDPFESLFGLGCYARKVLMSLANTSPIDTSGISWLINRHKRSRRGGQQLVLHSIPPRVNRVFQLMKLHLVLHLADNETAALAMTKEEKSRATTPSACAAVPRRGLSPEEAVAKLIDHAAAIQKLATCSS